MGVTFTPNKFFFFFFLFFSFFFGGGGVGGGRPTPLLQPNKLSLMSNQGWVFSVNITGLMEVLFFVVI